MSCCGGPRPPSSPAPASERDFELEKGIRLGSTDGEVLQSVKDYYGKQLNKTEDLKSSACLAKPPPAHVRKLLTRVPEEVKAKFYGCGSPLPEGIQGLRVLDLGCGSGQDCYVAAALVGAGGHVTGVDMTPPQLDVARRHAEAYCISTLGYPAPNLRFVQGEIERLDRAGILDASVDLVISNCVVNLSPDKRAVLREAHRVLAPGGEMYFSDIYTSRRLPAELRTDPLLLGECVGGALYTGDFEALCREVGFADPRRHTTTVIEVTGSLASGLAAALGEPKFGQLVAALGATRFYSITYRLFKLPAGRLEAAAEDYGQAARYKGTVPGSRDAYALDEGSRFEAGKWYEVSGNTAAILGESWLARHFEVAGDGSKHFGPFTRSSAAPAADTAEQPAMKLGLGSCCG